MIFIGTYLFEVVEGPLKVLKLKSMSTKEMGPYRTNPEDSAKPLYSTAISEAYRDSAFRILNDVTRKIFNEQYYMKDSSMKRLEHLAKHYEFEHLIAWFERYWQKMEDVSFANQLPLEAQNRPRIEEENKKKIKEFEEDLKLEGQAKNIMNAKIRYLTNQNMNLSSRMKRLEADFLRMEDQDYDSQFIEEVKKNSDYSKLSGKYRSNVMTIENLKGKTNKTVVTDDMIEQAKKVPFSKILKLERVGGNLRCKCPFHTENTPSFYVYPDTNRGYCHGGCGKSVDTIQFMVEKRNLKFNQAVLTLLAY